MIPSRGGDVCDEDEGGGGENDWGCGSIGQRFPKGDEPSLSPGVRPVADGEVVTLAVIAVGK